MNSSSSYAVFGQKLETIESYPNISMMATKFSNSWAYDLR